MDPSSLKAKLLTADEVRRHVQAFTEAVGEAIPAEDEPELWNAAFEYAQEHSLSSRQMTAILAVLRRRRAISARVLTDWARDAPEALGETSIPIVPDVLTNRGIEAHAVSTSGWEHGEVVRDLYLWAERFNQQFFEGALPPPAISVARARPTILGSYQLTRDGLGLKYRININAANLDRGRVDVLETLLHEMVHEWEEVVHGRKEAGQYHTKIFRDKAEEFGIPTDEHGHSLGVVAGSPFAKLLQLFGVSRGFVEGERIAVAKPRKPTLQKWSCACTNIWSSRAAEVQGVCQRCEQRWVRSR